MPNPFFYGNPASPDQFVDRESELRRIVSRIVNHGQSTSIVGEPRSGKTSMLLYLAAAEARWKFYGVGGERLVFSFLDAQTLGGRFDQARFWEYVLRPLQEDIGARLPDSPLAQAYELCRKNSFGCFVLERLLSQVGAENWRLVLLLDEFDVLLYHPVLNSAEFFGSLRSLVSRSRGVLVLVIASTCSLASLNDATQQFSHTGSPYFNFPSEITLGSLPPRGVAELLLRAGDRFTSSDRRLINRMAGGHPYLLQVAASELWEAYTEGYNDHSRRWRQVGERFYAEAARTLSDTWRLWSPAARRAFATVALAHMSALEQTKIRLGRLLRDLEDLLPELRLLKERGFVTEDVSISGGWRVCPQVFLWWLADDLARAVRREMSFEEWLQEQGLSTLLSRSEKEEWGKTVTAIKNMLRGGAKTLVEAMIGAWFETMLTGV